MAPVTISTTEIGYRRSGESRSYISLFGNLLNIFLVDGILMIISIWRELYLIGIILAILWCATDISQSYDSRIRFSSMTIFYYSSVISQKFSKYWDDFFTIAIFMNCINCKIVEIVILLKFEKMRLDIVNPSFNNISYIEYQYPDLSNSKL